MKTRLASLLAALWLLISPALAANQASTVTPTTGPMSATVFTGTYLNPALQAIFTNNWGPSAPANGPGAVPAFGQWWLNTTSATAEKLSIHDGTTWVTLASLNTSTHKWFLDSSVGRTLLSSNTDTWVRGDGSDANCTGMVNAAYSSGSFPQPCSKATWNNLYTMVATTLDFGGFQVTMKSGTRNTYAAGLAMGFGGNPTTAWVGGGSLIVDLAGSNIAETVTKGIINNVTQPGGIGIQNNPIAITSISNASPGVVTQANTFVGSEPAYLSTTGALPNPLVVGTQYYIKSPVAGSFNLSLTPGGAAINTTTAGSGTHSITTGGVISSAGFACIQMSAPGAMGIGAGITTGTCFDAAYEAIQGGLIALGASVNSVGTGGHSFVLTATGGNFGFNGQTVNHLSNQAYSIGYATSQWGSVILANSVSFNLNPAGGGGPFTITGPKYSVSQNGSIYTGATVNYFPGSTAGALASGSGGCYDNTCYGDIADNTAMLGSLIATAIATPATPAAGKVAIYAYNSSGGNLQSKNDAGNVFTTVSPGTAATNFFVRGVDSFGFLVTAQPTVANLADVAWTTYTPTLQPGSFGTATYTAAGRSKTFGKTVIAQTSITITAVGTAAGAMQIVLPFASSNSANYVGTCYESGVTGKSGAAITQVGTSNRMFTTDATGATWFATGKVVDCTITYEIP